MEELTQSDSEYFKQLLDNKPKTNAYVNGSVNGIRKPEVNDNQLDDKKHLILQLKNCNYMTSAKVIASLLEKLFIKWPSVDGHWLYIAQHYNPKTINSILGYMVYKYNRDGFWPKSPPSYFTDIIQHKLMRKIFRNIRKNKKKEAEK